MFYFCFIYFNLPLKSVECESLVLTVKSLLPMQVTVL